MMRRSKLLILCSVLTVGLVFATGCSRDGNNNDTQAPYEDETNRDVNDMDNNTNNGVNNGTTVPEDTTNNGAVNDMERSGNNLKDAGRNLIDSVEDAGSAIIDGVEDMGNRNNTNNTNRNGQ